MSPVNTTEAMTQPSNLSHEYISYDNAPLLLASSLIRQKLFLIDIKAHSSVFSSTPCMYSFFPNYPVLQVA